MLLCAERAEAARLANAVVGLGRRIVATPFGPSALDLAVDASLVVVDRTPNVEATEVVARLKADPRLGAIPVLALAQSDSVEERIALLDAGADDVMARPIDDMELAARVDGLLLRTPVAWCAQAPSSPPSRRTGHSGRGCSGSSPRTGVSARPRWR